MATDKPKAGTYTPPKAPREPVSGPVTQRHMLATGQKHDGTENPYGTGAISKKSTIAGKHGW